MQAVGLRRRALAAAFPRTIPVLAGYLFLGLANGILMKVSGFPFWYPLILSITVYGGSLQYVGVSVLTAAFAPVQTLVLTLMLHVRHVFYGLALLDKYKGLGWKKFYLIFGLTDETFSITCTVETPEGVDKGWFLFFVTLLNHSYWITGTTLGGLLGELISFSTEGLDFVMTAMFVVIFLDHWMQKKERLSALIGVGASVACLLGFGSESFLLPAMICILLLLTLFRKPIEKEAD